MRELALNLQHIQLLFFFLIYLLAFFCELKMDVKLQYYSAKQYKQHNISRFSIIGCYFVAIKVHYTVLSIAKTNNKEE